jgi:hypothetical protein
MNKDDACGVGNHSTPKYKVLCVFCLFLCVSLIVLVSLFQLCVIFFLKITGSLAHSNLNTEKQNTQKTLSLGVVEFHTTYIVFINFYLCSEMKNAAKNSHIWEIT